MKTTTLSTLQIRTFTFLFFSLVIVSGLLIFAKGTHAAPDNEALGWAMPVASTANTTCFTNSSNLSLITVVLTSSQNDTLRPTANIKLQSVANPGSQVVVSGGNQADLGCIDPNAGIWVTVWGNGSYQSWNSNMTFNGDTRQYNWCCGFRMLDPNRDRGKRLVYYIYLVPTGQQNSMRAEYPQPNDVDILTNGSSANVTFNLRSIRRLPPGGGTNAGGTVISNAFVWLRNVNGTTLSCGQSTCTYTVGCFGTCGGPFSFGSVIPIQVNSLPLGRYLWYGQMHEDPRDFCPFACIPDTIPITAQDQFQFFDIVQTSVPQPPQVDIKANGSDGPITIGYNTSATISWTSSNATSCLVTPGNWTELNHPGRSSGNLQSSRTYTLECSNSGGSATDTVRVNVNPPPNAADLRVSVFNDINGNGLVDSALGENTILLADAPNIVVKRNPPTSLGDIPLDGATLFHSYEEDVSAGNYQIYLDPTSSYTPTRYSFNRRFATPTAFNYQSATAPYIRTGSHNLEEGGIWFFRLGVRPVAGQPDLDVVGPSANSTGTTISATVHNGGNGSSTTTTQTRLCIKLNQTVLTDPDPGYGCNGYDITSGGASQVGGHRPVGLLSANDPNSSTDEQGVSWTWNSPQAGTHFYKICADFSRIENESNEDNNCESSIFTVNPDTSWLKTEDGNVGSEGGINLRLPHSSLPASEFNAEYLTVWSEASNALIDNAKGWLVGGPSPSTYGLTLPTPKIYSGDGSFFEEYGQKAKEIPVLVPSNLMPTPQGADSVFIFKGNVNWSGGFENGACGNDSQRSVVVFVEGTLTIQNNSTYPNSSPCPTVIIVRDTITVQPNVTRIGSDAAGVLLISNSPFTSGTSTERLRIDGAVYSSLGTGISLAPDFEGRTADGAGGPAVHIVHDPRIFWAMTSQLGVSKTTYTEINP